MAIRNFKFSLCRREHGVAERRKEPATILHLTNAAFYVIAIASMGVRDPWKIARQIVPDGLQALEDAEREHEYDTIPGKFRSIQKVLAAKRAVDRAAAKAATVAEFAKEILESDSPNVRTWIERFPHGRCLPLPEGVRGIYCRTCRTFVSWVPCPVCYPGMGVTSLSRLEKREPADPIESTDAEPGTQEKIEVMAKRHAAGMKVFHDKDAKLRRT